MLSKNKEKIVSLFSQIDRGIKFKVQISYDNCMTQTIIKRGHTVLHIIEVILHNLHLLFLIVCSF